MRIPSLVQVRGLLDEEEGAPRLPVEGSRGGVLPPTRQDTSPAKPLPPSAGVTSSCPPN